VGDDCVGVRGWKERGEFGGGEECLKEERRRLDYFARDVPHISETVGICLFLDRIATDALVRLPDVPREQNRGGRGQHDSQRPEMSLTRFQTPPLKFPNAPLSLSNGVFQRRLQQRIPTTPSDAVVADHDRTNALPTHSLPHPTDSMSAMPPRAMDGEFVSFMNASVQEKESFALAFISEYELNKEEFQCYDNVDMAQIVASQLSMSIEKYFFDVDYEQNVAVMTVYVDDSRSPVYRRIETIRPTEKRPRAE
jgi:hypothetical protein